MALDEFLGNTNFLFLKSEELFDAARSRSLWYVSYGIACCAIENIMHASGPRFDLDRFGIFPRASPRQADVLLVAGTVNKKHAEVARRLYDEMPEPKYVIAVGACACTGGPFREYPNVVMGVDKIMPVDVYVPGCPPRPESMFDGFFELMEKIKAETPARAKAGGDHE